MKKLVEESLFEYTASINEEVIENEEEKESICPFCGCEFLETDGECPDCGSTEVDESAGIIKGEKEIGLEASDVDPKEFLVGIAVEKEHSSNLAVCKTIALQHLAENPKYYSEGMKKGIFDEPAAINIYKKYFIDKKEPEESELM